MMLCSQRPYGLPVLIIAPLAWKTVVPNATIQDAEPCTQALSDSADRKCLADASAAVDSSDTRRAPEANRRGSERGYVGVVLPRRAVEITSRLQLPIESIRVDLGDELEANTSIAELGTAVIERELDIAQQSKSLSELQAGIAKTKRDAAGELHAIIKGLHEEHHASERELRESEL